ncbi:sensor domain-containing diguanylate cyclase [Tsukamurella pseudospumae]|uniref:GGDEF domain-containing protein n=1 Tax=Tsukamurella pseudospumae TaxID=239498 RepID=A0A137ZTH0_9ACTN|nr:GGDEF domain-containing protein [Tsukamurella pseudospumae]KXP01478.1 hypothetical protein AXK61_01305 [Tsukamurella pseudospumae]
MHRLADREAWRRAGTAEYASASSWLKVQGGGLALRVAVGGLALMMVPLCIGVLFSDARPSTPIAMAVFVVSSSGSAVLGVWWLRLRRPSARDAIRFVAVADVCLFAGCLAQSGAARISGTTYLGMLAMLTAFLLGWRILLLHCMLSVVAVVATTVTTMVVDGATLGELYATLAPALAIVFALPMMVQFVVESGRRGIGVVVTERNRDPLTGVYNRFGLQAALRVLARREHGAAFVAMVDLDGFKQYNDRHGHLAGDQRLVEVGRTLRGGLPGALVARMGGDEFLVVAVRPSRAETTALVDRLRGLLADGAPPAIVGSAGVVVRGPLAADELARVVAEADRALYAAKGDRSVRLVVRQQSGEEE